MMRLYFIRQHICNYIYKNILILKYNRDTWKVMVNNIIDY